MLRFFIEGGPLFMGLLTIILVFLFIAVWKALVREKYWIIGVLSTLLGFAQAGMPFAGRRHSMALIASGIKVAFIPPFTADSSTWYL